MDVILLERVENLGQMGDVVTVRPGYARNFLLPRNKALRATDDNRKAFEERRVHLETENLDKRKDAEDVAAKMGDLSVILTRQAGEAGQLYGSVNSRDIADAVSEAGFSVGKRQVRMDQPIKAIGLHDVRIDLHPEVSVTVSANVARSAEEASVQAKTGRAVIHSGEEEAVDLEAEKEAVAAAAEEVFEAPTEELIAELVEEPEADSPAGGGHAPAEAVDSADTDAADETAETSESTDDTPDEGDEAKA